MSDPEIIKSSTPHRVSMPEGSSNAVGKKAEVGETSIRKVLSEGTGETNEIESDKETLKGPPPKLSLDDEIAAAKELAIKNKELRAEKEGVHTDDELRAGKAGHKVSEDLHGKMGVGHDEELKAACFPASAAVNPVTLDVSTSPAVDACEKALSWLSTFTPLTTSWPPIVQLPVACKLPCT